MAKIQVPDLFEETLEHGSTAKALKAAHTGATGAKTAMVAVDDIHVIKDLNPRVKGTKAYKDHVESIGKSIIANGYYQDKPLAVFVRKIDGVDTICLRDGHHRHAGIEWANKKAPGTVEFVPVVFDAEEMSNADMIVSFATGNMGKPLNPYELGVVVKRLAAEGVSKKEIATRLAITDRYIDDLGILMQAPEDVIEMVLNDQVSATLAIEMAKAHGEKAAKHLLKAAEKLAAIGKPGSRITSKHIEPEARPKTKKSATDGKKPETDTSTATAKDTTEQEPGTTFVRDLSLDAALKALRVLNGFECTEEARGDLDGAMKAIVEEFGDTDLINYAVDENVADYEETGLVRLGLVVVEAEEPPVIEEPAPKPKRDRSKKTKTPADPAPSEAEKAHIEEAAADL